MFRFSIRDALLGMLVIGMGLGWWCDRQQLKAEVGKHSERAEFLEWQKMEVATLSGCISAATMKKVIEEDQRQKKRFAGQAAAKSETTGSSRQSRLPYVKHLMPAGSAPTSR